MLEVDPLARGRARVERRAEGLRIEIPVKREPWVLVGISVLVLGVAVACVANGFMVWPAVAAAASLILLAWVLLGREVITVTGGELVLERGLGPLGREKRLAGDRIERLRTDPYRGYFRSAGDTWRGQWEAYGLSGGSVVFDYGARTHRFGSMLDEAEARRLVELIARELRI